MWLKARRQPKDAQSRTGRGFLRERLHFYLKDVRGFAYDVVNAVLAAGADDVRDAIARAEALTAVRGSEDFAAISAAFKRIKNILRQAEEKKFAIGSAKDAKLAAGGAAARRCRCVPCAQGGSAPAGARLQRGAGVDRDAAAGCGCVLRQGDGARSRSEQFAARILGLIDEVLRGFSGIADFSEIVTA